MTERLTGRRRYRIQKVWRSKSYVVLQVERLRAWQSTEHLHPFTCPGNLDVCSQQRELIPTVDGWVCACGEFKQTWAYDVMLDKMPPPNPLTRLKISVP